jgi:hypothetical protein
MAVHRAERWAISSDNLVTLTGLHDPVTGGWINDATVTAQLTDSDGTNVGSAITFSYRNASNGVYDGTVPNSLSLTDGDQYTLTITAQATIGANTYKLVRKITRVAKNLGP